jgi:hypothetical protein
LKPRGIECLSTPLGPCSDLRFKQRSGAELRPIGQLSSLKPVPLESKVTRATFVRFELSLSLREVGSKGERRQPQRHDVTTEFSGLCDRPVAQSIVFDLMT